MFANTAQKKKQNTSFTNYACGFALMHLWKAPRAAMHAIVGMHDHSTAVHGGLHLSESFHAEHYA